MSKIAVLLAAYNGAHYIQEQLDSVLRQNKVELSLYISVDASSDDTLSICNRYAEQHKNITVLSYGIRYGGASANFFRLIREVDFSSCSYIAFADQDDIWLPDKLNQAISRLSDGKFQAYSSSVIAFWETGRQVFINKAYPQKELDFLFESAGQGCTYVTTRQVILQFRSYITQHRESVASIRLHDWLLYAYCRTHGIAWYMDERAFILYRQHANNEFGVNHGLKGIIYRMKAVYSGWYRNQVEEIAKCMGQHYLDKISSRLCLIRNFYQLRRKPSDALALLLMLMTIY